MSSTLSLGFASAALAAPAEAPAAESTAPTGAAGAPAGVETPTEEAAPPTEGEAEAEAELPAPTVDEALADPEPDLDEDQGAIDDTEAEGEAKADSDEPAEAIRPPRVDGPYVGLLAFGGATFASVLNFDTAAPLLGGGGYIQAGDAVFPWFSIGIAAGGQYAATGDQTMFGGGLLVELAFLPSQRFPLSLHTGFGFGGGAVNDANEAARSGYGGALFKGSLRYEFFPLAGKNRPDRGGGWAIGPELGWLGATPAAKGQPFANTVLLGLSTSFYFGS